MLQFSSMLAISLFVFGLWNKWKEFNFSRICYGIQVISVLSQFSHLKFFSYTKRDLFL